MLKKYDINKIGYILKVFEFKNKNDLKSISHAFTMRIGFRPLIFNYYLYLERFLGIEFTMLLNFTVCVAPMFE